MAEYPFMLIPIEVVDPTMPVFNPNDPWVDGGVLFIGDTMKGASWAPQANPTNGAIWNNIVAGGPNATINVASAGITFDQSAFRFAGTAGNYIDLGDNYNFNQAGAVPPNILILFYMKRDGAYSTANNQRVIGYTENDNVQWMVDLAAGGVYLRGQAHNASTSVSMTASQAQASEANKWIQWGFALENGVAKVYKDGVLVNTPAGTLPGPLKTLTGGKVFIGGDPSATDTYTQFKGLLRYVAISKLTSGKTALERLTEHSTIHRARLTA